MPEAWSRVEVEATVSSYFAMLERELRGESYNKSESRRHLMKLLDGRPEGAVERKHQNISAILIELGFPYITGYKPLRNYQQLLFEIVEDRLTANRPLLTRAREDADAPAAVPTVDDILRRMVEPPRPSQLVVASVRDRPRVARRVDYLALEARNRSLGDAGEAFVVNFEVARLLAARKDALAGRVERVSATRGDGLGYDVLSFETSGRDRLIEVKTTAYGNETPFYVTKNELEVSSDRAEEYQLYRVFEFRRDPKFFVREGPIGGAFRLDAVEWVARV